MCGIDWHGRSHGELGAGRRRGDHGDSEEACDRDGETAEQFRRLKSHLVDEGRYYRFNVDRGLEDVRLEESKKKDEIAWATRRYIAMDAVLEQMKACASNIAGRECKSRRSTFDLLHSITINVR